MALVDFRMQCFQICFSPVFILTSTFDAIYAADLWLRYFVVP
jgi:hypothetical protein